MCIPIFGMPLDATGTLFCFWMLRAPHISKTSARLMTMAILTKGEPLAFACFLAGMIIAGCIRHVLLDAANLDTLGSLSLSQSPLATMNRYSIVF